MTIKAVKQVKGGRGHRWWANELHPSQLLGKRCHHRTWLFHTAVCVYRVDSVRCTNDLFVLVKPLGWVCKFETELATLVFFYSAAFEIMLITVQTASLNASLNYRKNAQPFSQIPSNEMSWVDAVSPPACAFVYTDIQKEQGTGVRIKKQTSLSHTTPSPPPLLPIEMSASMSMNICFFFLFCFWGKCW